MNFHFKRKYATAFDVSLWHCGMISNAISLISRDGDTDSEKRQFDAAFCIRWPEYTQLKVVIITNLEQKQKSA